MTAPLIWNILSAYLNITENWIYTSLANQKNVRVAVASQYDLINLDVFPPANFDLVSLQSLIARPRYWPLRAILKPFPGAFVRKSRTMECERLMSLHPPAVIHAHFGPIGYSALDLKRRLGVPLVTTFYGYDTNPAPGDPVWSRQRQELLAQGDLFLAEGPFMRQALIDMGCAPERVRVQKIAVDFRNLTPSDPRPLHAIPVILMAARFVEKKGLIYGLQAIDSLVRSGLRFECRVVGDGVLDEVLRNFVRNNNLDSVVKFLGPLPHSRFLEELRTADIFLQPSVMAADGNREGGAPVSILEAQALRVPVVSTTHADIPNTVQSGVSAILTPERDSDALAAAITELLANPDRRKAMGEAGRAFVTANHSVEKVVPALEAVYMSLI